MHGNKGVATKKKLKYESYCEVEAFAVDACRNKFNRCSLVFSDIFREYL